MTAAWRTSATPRRARLAPTKRHRRRHPPRGGPHPGPGRATGCGTVYRLFGEEQGYWGSTAYAQHVEANGIDVQRLINLDQVGYPPADLAVIVERDLGNAVASNDAPSQAFGGDMAQMAADYSAMPVQLGPIYGSDYMPFEARGYVVIGAYEAGNNPDYHTSADTPEHRATLPTPPRWRA